MENIQNRITSKRHFTLQIFQQVHTHSKTVLQNLCGKLLVSQYNLFFMPPTLKKLMGHIAFGASVSGCVGAWVTLFVPTVTFKPLKLES